MQKKLPEEFEKECVMEWSCQNPAVFWFWNTDLSETGIAGQLKEIRNAGFRSVCIHPMPEAFDESHFFRKGMRMKYLGTGYFSRFRFAVRECRRLGLSLTLYDEGGWPSGSACGAVIRKNPDLAAWVLVRTEKGKFLPQQTSLPNRIDLMNPEAARLFLKLTHEKYRKAAGRQFGRTIRGIFTDEARWCGRVGSNEIPWSPCLPEEFFRRNGFPVEEIYEMLFPLPEITEEIRRMRRLYLECCTALTVRNFFGILERWCRKHGIALEGHLSGEDEFRNHAGAFGNALAVLDCMESPGVDAIWRQIWPGGEDGSFAKIAASSAIRRKRKTVLSESFNVYGYDLTSSSMNWIANAQFIRGVNRLMVMPFLAGIRGGRQWGCCTDFSPRNPLWRLFPALTAHWEWIGAFDAGALEAPVRILYDPQLPASEEEGRRMEVEWKTLARALDEDRVFWRFAGKEELQDPKMTLDPRSVSEADRRKWKEFSVLPVLPSEGVFQVLPCRRMDGDEAVMVFCKGPGEGVFRFRASENEFWKEIPPPDSLPSEVEALNRIANGYEIRFAPGEMRIIRRSDSRMPEVAPVHRICRVLEWKVESLEAYSIGSSRPRRVRIGEKLPPDGEWRSSGSKLSGVLHLSAEVEFRETEVLPFCIAFRWVGCGAILAVNGKKTGIRAFPPWVFPLDGIRNGVNHFQLEVVGTLAEEWKRVEESESERRAFGNPYSCRIAAFPPDDRRFGVSPEVEFLVRRKKKEDKII